MERLRDYTTRCDIQQEVAGLLALAEKKLASLPPAPPPSPFIGEAGLPSIEPAPTLLNFGMPMCFEWKANNGWCSQGRWGKCCEYGHPPLPVGRDEVTAEAVVALSDEALNKEAARLGVAVNTEKEAMFENVRQARAEERAKFLAHPDRARQLGKSAVLQEKKVTIQALARAIGLSAKGTNKMLAARIDEQLRKKHGPTTSSKRRSGRS
jgi:hypothetical protein